MPSKTAILVASVPKAMFDQVEKLRGAEQRTRSELVREALRVYFARAAAFPEVTATPTEIRALKRARAAYARGDTTTLDEYLARPVDGAPTKRRRKAAPKTAPARSRSRR